MRALLLTGLLALPAAAETRQHGNVTFDLPQGWVLGAVEEDGTRILWSDLPNDECEYCRIYIATSTLTGGRADTWIASQTARFTDPDEEAPDIKQMAAPEIFNLKGRPAAQLGQLVDGDMQTLFAVQLFGRMELVGFEAPASDEAELKVALHVLERDMAPLLESLAFVSEGATPVMPAPQPGDLAGVWWGTSTWWTIGLDGMMQMQIDHHWLTFWPDGTFYSGTAPQGTAAFDPAERLALGDMDWGSYTVDGGTLHLAFATGETEDYTLDDERLVQGDTVLGPIELLADGTKINGMISTFFFTGFTPGAGISGGVSSATETHFHPDGSWTYGSSGGAFGGFENGGGFATSSENERAGRYEVKNGLVIRYLPDGTLDGQTYIFKSGSDIWVGSEALK
jgi:hypothetical protein